MCGASAAPAAAQVILDERAWWNLTGQSRSRAESPLRWYVELQGRTRDGLEDLDQLLVRPALIYDLDRQSSLWVGYGYIGGYRPTGGVLDENRPWQQ